MVQTVKFSQFVQGGTLDANGRPVGLEDGDNTIWDYSPGGGAGEGVTATITRPGNTLVKGDWVTIDAAGNYIQAQADTAQHGECVGVVIEIITVGDTFVVQQSGYVTTAKAVFAGLQPGDPYFLSATGAGAMTNVDVTTNGFISRPVFYADSDTSGWVLPYRGQIRGGVPLPNGGGSSVIPDIVTVDQNGHGLAVGQWVRVDAPVAGQAHYVTAQGDTLANAQCVGVVIQVVNANQFILQFSGYNIGAVTADYLMNVLVPPNVYYLSPTNTGAITSTNPKLVGQISKPVYISERVTANGGVNAGYILPQRPLDLSTSEAIGRKITQANAFSIGDWLYVSADGVYSKGIATSLATSQVVGVVTLATVNDFVLQTEGFVDGVVINDGAGVSVVSANVYYLSDVVGEEGRLTPVAPVAPTSYTKPCYVQQTLATRTGIILPQRPLQQIGGGGAGGSIVQCLAYQDQAIHSVNYNSGGYAAIPFITGTITPSLITSKIRITICVSVYQQYSSYYNLFRNGVIIPSPAHIMWHAGPTNGGGSQQEVKTLTFMYIDSPASVVPQTYDLRIIAENPIGVINAAFNSTTGGGPMVTSWTLEEIRV